MPHFCSLQSSSCPIDPMTAKPMEKCANLTSTGESGNICRSWAQQNVKGSNASKLDYCNKFNTPDCQCLNRSDNKIYKLAKNGNPFNDGCWWIPCGNPSTYLVTSNLIPRPGDCPQRICSIINNILAESGSQVNIKDVEEVINCPINGDTRNDWDKYKWWIIGAVVLIGVLIILVFLLRHI